jgi:hypothetical protein
MTKSRARAVGLPVLFVAAAGALVVALVVAYLGLHKSPKVQAYVPPPPLVQGAPKLLKMPAVPAASVPPLGYDVSHPQCKKTLPSDGGFAIVGVTGGHPFSSNKCVGDQLKWAVTKSGHAVYVNSGFPGSGDPIAYGTSIADDAVTREHAQSGRGTAVWWLDVETANTWAGTTQQNASVIDAMASRLQQLGVRVGIYSTPQMWAEIAGDWSPGLPVWYATGPGTVDTATAACDKSFAGSPAAVVQWVQKTTQGELDHNMVCPAFQNRAGELLDLG